MANKLITSAMLDKHKLKHYGVLGMKWGVITEKAKGSLSPNVSKLQKAESRSNSEKDKNKRLLQELNDDKVNRISNFKDIPRFNPKTESINDAIKKVNEGYEYSNLIDSKKAKEFGLSGTTSDGNTYIKNFANNCMSASFAYELRRRGFDVEAGLVDTISHDEIAAAMNISSLEYSEEQVLNSVPPKTFEELLERMEEMGPGARGFCMIEWKVPGGHICSFEVNAKGEVVFVDAQTGVSSKTPGIKDADNPAEYHKSASKYYILRTDDKTINKDAVKDYVRLDDRVSPRKDWSNVKC